MLIHSIKLWSSGWLLPVKWHQRQTWPCSKANAQLGHAAAELNRPTNHNKGFSSKQKRKKKQKKQRTHTQSVRWHFLCKKTSSPAKQLTPAPSWIIIMHRLNFMQTTSLGHSPGSRKETNQETIRPLYLQNTFSLKNVFAPSASNGLKAWQMTLWLWCCEVRFRDRELCTDTPPNWAVLGGCSAPWNLGQTPPIHSKPSQHGSWSSQGNHAWCQV